jgi:3-keto-disaccharide hydrolase
MRNTLLRVAIALVAGISCFAQASPKANDATNDATPEFAALEGQLSQHRGTDGSAAGNSAGWKSLYGNDGLKQWRLLDRPETEKPESAWETMQVVSLDEQDPKRLARKPVPGADAGGRTAGAFVNSREGRSPNLITIEEYTDTELYVEFMVPQGSNSGVCLMGLYEIQIFDSYGNTDLRYTDNGGIYGRPAPGGRVDGRPPPVNVSRAPGQWQSFHIWFRAPRFDAAGAKIENARFLRVEHNGTLLHENVDLKGSTRARSPWSERASAPLLLQGDHGPVAFRNIYIRPLQAAKP